MFLVVKITLLFGFGIFACNRVDAQTYDLIDYNFNGTPAHGVKIKTNIPFLSGGSMPTVHLEIFVERKNQEMNRFK